MRCVSVRPDARRRRALHSVARDRPVSMRNARINIAARIERSSDVVSLPPRQASATDATLSTLQKGRRNAFTRLDANICS